MIILPYRKGARPENLTVVMQDADTAIHSGSMTLTLTGHGFFCENGARKNLTSFDNESVAAFGIKFSGGPAEARMTATNGTFVICGASGTRALELPEGWSLRQPDKRRDVTVRQSGRVYQVDVTGKDPVELALERK